ncbi:MAG: hypothetical protein A2287_11070 [Candidatus Melainabacteria bacterium RIFOXYA12_FULL_32_12]|nr:MAG: hypothetical protein A2255_02885 [Candidatus Melainabacteria bacterium RIFOXYA2_FULL_32_9]OGI30486.1 MAG: hypothetical protein A2287_11070 [Candidatus Melainabacteria bacterium RIFOXYA12_FULL_32_12]
MKKRFSGFSLAEVLLSLMLVSIIFVMTLPLMLVKKGHKGIDLSTVTCVVTEQAGDPESDACSSSIERCKQDQNNACDTLLYYAEEGSVDEKTAARSILKEVCDEGGKRGCEYFANRCKDDNSTCDIAGDNDLRYYLNLPVDTINSGKLKIIDIAQNFYNYGYSNITDQVDSYTCCPDLYTACIIKGITSCGGGGPPPTCTTCPWALRFDSPNHKNDETDNYVGSSIALDGSGNIYVTGSTNNGTVSSILVMKLLTDGNIAWQKKYHSSDTTKNDRGYGIAVDPGGNVYVTGESTSASNTDIAVLKLNPNGNLMWGKRLKPTASTGTDKGWAIAVQNGNIHITGITDNYEVADAIYDIFVVKLNSTGGVIWEKRYNSSNTNSFERGYGIIVDKDYEDVYVAGYSFDNDAGYNNAALIKINAAGTGQWAKRYSSDADVARGGMVLYYGNLYLTGSKGDWPNATSITVMKIGTDSAVIWRKKYDASNHGDDYGIDITVEEHTGYIYVSGHSINAAGNDDAAILKMDNDGNMVWDKRFDATNHEGDMFQGMKAHRDMLNIVGYSNNGANLKDLLVVRMNRSQTASDNVFSSTTYALTTQAPFTTTDPNFIDSAPSFTSSDLGFTTNSPGFPAFD